MKTNCYFHHKQNLQCKKQQLYRLMLTTMLLAHVVGKKSLHTSVPISHVETLLLFYLFYFLIYVMNRTVIFQTYWNTFHEIAKAEPCFWYQRAKEWSGSGKWWTWSGAGAEWLLNARSAEGILLTLHSAHILCQTPPHKCGFLLMTVLLQDLTE